MLMGAARAKATKTVRCAKRHEADIATIREGRDNAARRFLLAFARRISDSGHWGEAAVTAA
jgi:hypothetical protein